jgi:transposase
MTEWSTRPLDSVYAAVFIDAIVVKVDHDAVHAAVTMPYHNGGTEGVNTKTKRIMRRMHGRAGFTLLRHRILLN